MLKKQLERTFLIGIGLLSLTREKAQAVVEDMVKQGSAAREEVKDLTDKLVERGEEERQARGSEPCPARDESRHG